jgi:hypothetical protein
MQIRDSIDVRNLDTIKEDVSDNQVHEKVHKELHKFIKLFSVKENK